MRKFQFLKTFNSPFKTLKLKWYFGPVAIGTPYFFPRKWVNSPSKPGYKMAVDKKIGFDFVDLGWKTKWKETDYRYEWSPIWSFVFFKWQIALMFETEEPEFYWESWLYYENNTDKSLTKRQRIEKCKSEYPLEFRVIKNGGEVIVNYYEKILKKEYFKTPQEIREDKIEKIIKNMGRND